MADDREILREVWDGKVPVCFSLANDEQFTDQPEPFYLLVPRQTYFPLVTEKVQRHFLKYVNSETAGEMWLEDEGMPIKWHYPIGVLFDLYGSEARLPWNLSVHFQNFPQDELLRCPSREAVESHFMAMVKEADNLKHRAQVVHSMQKRDHKQLWTGLQNDRFDQFWAVNRKLMEHNNDELFKFIPFRIYQPDKQFMQKLFRPVSDSDAPHTLEDLLKDVFPEAVPNEEGDCHHRVVIQGIEMPLEVSIQWLSEHFSHPDNFLHICIVPA